MHTPYLALLFLGALLASGCKSGNAQPTPEATVASAVAPAKVEPSAALPPPSVAAAPAPKVDLEITAVGNTMAFSKTALSVPAGATVHLTLKVDGPGILSHNWVLVRPGTEAAVAAAGLAKGQVENFVAPGPDVLVSTPLVAPGKSAEITFPAPAPGSYPYICTFPGHYLMMKGVLTVTP